MPQQNVNSRVRYHELPSSSASCWRYNMWLVQNCAAHCPVFKRGSSIREEGCLYPCFFSMEEMPIRTKTHTQWLYPHDIPIYFYIHHELSYRLLKTTVFMDKSTPTFWLNSHLTMHYGSLWRFAWRTMLFRKTASAYGLIKTHDILCIIMCIHTCIHIMLYTVHTHIYIHMQQHVYI